MFLVLSLSLVINVPVFVYLLSPQSHPSVCVVSLCSVSVNTFVVLFSVFLSSYSDVHLSVFHAFVPLVCHVSISVFSQSQCQADTSESQCVT